MKPRPLRSLPRPTNHSGGIKMPANQRPHQPSTIPGEAQVAFGDQGSSGLVEPISIPHSRSHRGSSGWSGEWG